MVLLLCPPTADYEGPKYYGSVSLKRIERLTMRDRVDECLNGADELKSPGSPAPAVEDDLLFSSGHTTDYYELLGLGMIRHRASSDDIRRAYKKASLLFHPDKSDHPNAIQRFKAITKAYEILSNPEKRLAFDSTDDVDDSVPDRVSAHAFYATLRPVFARNARWSVVQPVPDLGHENTAIDEVLAFYAFWDGFKTWRDFSADCEYDLDEAHNRDEKRWMMQQNRREQKAKVKAEKERIEKLINLAKTNDPRLAAYKEQKEREREEQEAARVAEEQRRKKSEERRARLRAEAKEREREAKERRFRTALTALEGKNDGSAEMGYLLKSLTIEDVDKAEVLMDEKSLAAELSEINQKIEAQKAAFEAKVAQSHVEEEWTDEQDRMLAVMVKKVNELVPKRWGKISNAVGRTEKDCIKRVKQLGHRKLTQLRGNTTANKTTVIASKPVETEPETPQDKAEDDGWTKKEQKAFEKGLRAYPEAQCRADGIMPSMRWELIAGFVPDKDAEECKQRFIWCKEQVAKKKAST
ncbi:DnaJ domain [Carpediemonas membranifera]|uniref:DnaJ domain n=1 Tax=Carpediemonas membranifera TaxID=201153 RepID=A0A8J6AQT7_9EUKA|nr:DnaJ domain [Carpediemonas membranifera]|eukprot:KAG9389750.1 DnaJ domain [Carpediemonas membranifera]